MLRNNYYLHFATDLRRAVFCLVNKNTEGAHTFLLHAKSIYDEHFSQEDIHNILTNDFESRWLHLYKSNFPTEEEKIKQFSDELLTLSSLVFYRVTAHLQKMDGPLSSVASNLESPVIPVDTALQPVPQKMKM